MVDAEVNRDQLMTKHKMTNDEGMFKFWKARGNALKGSSFVIDSDFDIRASSFSEFLHCLISVFPAV